MTQPRMVSLQLDAATERALDQLTYQGTKNRSDEIRKAIKDAARKPSSGPSLPSLDLGTAKRASLSLMDLLGLVVTGLEANDPESAVEMVGILENRLRHWREDRQTQDEQMETALGHVRAVMEPLKPKERAKAKAGAVQRMQEMFP